MHFKNIIDWLMHRQAAVISIACAVGMTMVRGLFPQVQEGWVHWLFLLSWGWVMLASGLATLNHLVHFKWADIPFILNHLGVFVAVVSAMLGSTYVQNKSLTVFYGQPAGVEAGWSIGLNEFTVDYYPDGAPKRFASDISILSADGGETLRGTVEVNKPLKVNGWKIYQYGYDSSMGNKSPYSVFLLVKDPWLPAVYTGIFLMLAGAVAMLFTRKFRNKKKKQNFLVPAGLLVATAVFVYFFTPVFRSKSLVPALQSPWFVPHVVVYMFAYALLSAATIMALYLLISKKATDNQLNITDNLVYAGLAFLTIGMLFGALWAKEAWGNYWTWDPKETWAAITWLCYLLYIHSRVHRPEAWKKAGWILLLAFLCLQMCWWGINYLPSARGLSIHLYN